MADLFTPSYQLKTQSSVPSEIILQLDHYDDIFSDFDPRSYDKKALSGDFLTEIKRASADKEDKIEFKLLIPKIRRNVHYETTIKKRLKEHFRKHYHILNKEKWNITKRGLFFISFGIILMFLATYVLFTYEEKSMIMNFLVVLLEPGGWFLFWEGLNLIIFQAKERNPEFKFYEKMTKCDISFMPS